MREETVRPYKYIAYAVKGKLYGAHQYGDQIDAQKILFSVMSVGEAFYHAKQKERCGQPAQLREEKRDFSGEAEKVVDMIQNHKNQGEIFEGEAGDAFSGRGMRCGCLLGRCLLGKRLSGKRLPGKRLYERCL